MHLEGQRIGGYDLLHLLGSGSTGEVYLAADPRIEQQVAIKVVRSKAAPYSDIQASKEETNLFLRQVKAIARLEHPNILPILDCGEEYIGRMKHVYIVMPYRREGSLAAWLRQRSSGEWPSLECLTFFLCQASAALQHAHDHHIIHQNVKPSNFLLGERKENPNYPDLILVDFDIAEFHSATSSASAPIHGTPTYMAPEQWSGHPVLASDQYALAVMIYQLLVRRPPFHGSLKQLMHMHMHMQPPPPSTFNSRISPAIDAVMMRALEKNAENRFPTVSAFANAFQLALLSPRKPDLPSPGPNKATPVPPLNNFTNRAQDNNQRRRIFRPQAALLIALMLLIIGGSLGAFTYITTNNQKKASHANATATAQTSIATTTTQDAVAVATASWFPYPPNTGTLVLNDPLTDNSRGYNWSRGYTRDDAGTECVFHNGAYHVIESNQGRFYYCAAQKTDFNNFAFQVRMTFIRGSGQDYGGILFRSYGPRQYFFRLGRNGSYLLKLYIDDSTGEGYLLKQGVSPAIHTGLNVPNILAVVAQGGNFQLYVNQQLITSASDTSYSQGQIALVAEDEKDAADVAFNDAKVWAL